MSFEFLAHALIFIRNHTPFGEYLSLELRLEGVLFKLTNNVL